MLIVEILFAPFLAPFNRPTTQPQPLYTFARMSGAFGWIFWGVVWLTVSLAAWTPDPFAPSRLVTDLVTVGLFGLWGVVAGVGLARGIVNSRGGTLPLRDFLAGVASPRWYHWAGAAVLFGLWVASGTQPILTYLFAGVMFTVPFLLAGRRMKARIDEHRNRVSDGLSLVTGLAAVFGITPEVVAGCLRQDADNTWLLDPAPARALAKLAADPVGVDAALDQLMDRDVVAERVGGAIALFPATDSAVAGRLVRSASNGLVESVTETGEPGVFDVQLTMSASPTKAAEVAAYLAGRGLDLVQWLPAEHRAVAAELSPTAQQVRARVAHLLKTDPWGVDLTVTEADDGRIDMVVINRAPLIHQDATKRIETWQTLILSLPSGTNGWEVDEDAAAGTVVLTYGEPRRLPEQVALAKLLPAGPTPDDWANLPLGVDETGKAVGIDLQLGPHTLLVGPTGSGKTVGLLTLMAGQFARGHDVVLIDAIKGGVDFGSTVPFLRGFGQDIPSALALLQAAYDEGQRRKQILLAEQEVKWSDLSAEVRKRENIRPLSVVIDEVGSLLLAPEIPKGLEKDDPELLEVQELVASKAKIKMLIGKIARELRFVGVHLVVALQRPDASILSGELRSNLTSTVQLTRPGAVPAREAIGMVFPGDTAAEAAETLRALDDGHSRGLGVVAGDGGDVTGLRVGYVAMKELPALLAERGIHPAPGAPLVPATAPTTPEPVAAATAPDFDLFGA